LRKVDYELRVYVTTPSDADRGGSGESNGGEGESIGGGGGRAENTQRQPNTVPPLQAPTTLSSNSSIGGGKGGGGGYYTIGDNLLPEAAYPPEALTR